MLIIIFVRFPLQLFCFVLFCSSRKIITRWYMDQNFKFIFYFIFVFITWFIAYNNLKFKMKQKNCIFYFSFLLFFILVHTFWNYTNSNSLKAFILCFLFPWLLFLLDFIYLSILIIYSAFIFLLFVPILS